jgi:hypothetical protein
MIQYDIAINVHVFSHIDPKDAIVGSDFRYLSLAEQQSCHDDMSERVPSITICTIVRASMVGDVGYDHKCSFTL